VYTKKYSNYQDQLVLFLKEHWRTGAAKLSGILFSVYFGFYPIHFDKKGQELNHMFIFSNVMLLGNFLFIFVIVTHVLLC
jgi:hypothetical protein